MFLWQQHNWPGRPTIVALFPLVAVLHVVVALHSDIHVPEPQSSEGDRIAAQAALEKDADKAAFLDDAAALVREGLPSLQGAVYRNATFAAVPHPLLDARSQEKPRTMPVWVYPNGLATQSGVGYVRPSHLGKALPLPTPPLPRRYYVSDPRLFIDELALVLEGREIAVDFPGFRYRKGMLKAAVLHYLSDQVLLRRYDRDDESAIRDADLFAMILKSAEAREYVGDLERLSSWPNKEDRDIVALANDSKRRLAHPRSHAVDLAKWRLLPTRERIANLMDSLDEEDSFMVINPGGVQAAFSASAREFDEIGDDAVEPLLNCAEHDTRFTRFCWETHHVPNEPLLGYRVSELALALAAHIIGEGQYNSVQDVRAYWERIRRHSGLQRWTAVLADPSNSPDELLCAAQRICSPKPGPSADKWNRDAHALTDPTVAQLFEDRIRELSARGQAFYDSEMAIMLAKWAPDKALPALQIACTDKSSQWGLGAVYAWRIKLGDKNAAGEYLHWYAGDSETSPSRSTEVQPFNAFPNDPVLAPAAPAVFAALFKDSGPERMPGAGSFMVRFVFDRALKFLSDRSVIGHVERLGNYCESDTEFTTDEPAPPVANPTSQSTRPYPLFLNYVAGIAKEPTNSWIADGSKSDVLACDGMAKLLSQMRGVPFCYGWTRARRDIAVADATKWLQDHKGKFDRLPFFSERNFEF
jgi:hypothetical protein